MMDENNKANTENIRRGDDTYLNRLLVITQQLIEENQKLKDKIAGLKGQKPRPKIKPSNLNKEGVYKQGTDKKDSGQRRKSKTKDIKIHQQIRIHPDNIPLGRWSSYLKAIDIVMDHHVRIATEGVLVGSIICHDFNKDLAIISDDAGQFNIFLHGLCWVHAERSIHKLIGFTDKHKKILEEIRSDIWQFYHDLKAYRINPDEITKIELKERFDKVFVQKTGFASLGQALKRIHQNKSELLLVLDRPDIPLHNNLSETDIRGYVKDER